MANKRELKKGARQTFITLKCRSYLERNCRESQCVGEHSFLHHQKALRNWMKLEEEVCQTHSHHRIRRQVFGSQLWREDFELEVWLVECQLESHSYNGIIWKRGFPGPWHTAHGLLKNRRRSYGPVNQIWKYLVQNTGFLCTVEKAKGWFLSVWHQLVNMEEEGWWSGAPLMDPELTTCTEWLALNQKGYHSVLQHHAIPSGLHFVGQGIILQQDNDLKHVSRLCQNGLRGKNKTVDSKS